MNIGSSGSDTDESDLYDQPSKPSMPYPSMFEESTLRVMQELEEYGRILQDAGKTKDIPLDFNTMAKGVLYAVGVFDVMRDAHISMKKKIEVDASNIKDADTTIKNLVSERNELQGKLNSSALQCNSQTTIIADLSTRKTQLEAKVQESLKDGLEKTKDISDKDQQILDLQKTNKDQAQKIDEITGRNTELEKVIEELNAQLIDSKKRCGEQKIEISSLNGRIEELGNENRENVKKAYDSGFDTREKQLAPIIERNENDNKILRNELSKSNSMVNLISSKDKELESVKAELNKAELELNEAKKEILQLTYKIKVIETANENVSAELENLKEESSNFNNCIESLNSDIRKLNGEIHEKERSLGKLNHDFNTISEENQRRKSECDSLNEKLASREVTMSNLAKESERLKIVEDSLTKQLEQYMKLNAKQTTKLFSFENENVSDLKNKLNDASNRIEHLEKVQAQFYSEASEWNAMQESYKKESIELKEKVAILQNELSAYQNKGSSMWNEIYSYFQEEYNKNIAEINSKHNQDTNRLESELNVLKKTSHEYELNLKHYMDLSVKNQLTITQMESLVDSLNEQLKLVETDKRELLTKSSQADLKIDELQTHLNTLNAKLEEFDNLNTSAQQQREIIESLNGTLNEIKSEYTECNNQLENSRLQYQQAKKEININHSQIAALKDTVSSLSQDSETAKALKKELDVTKSNFIVIETEFCLKMKDVLNDLNRLRFIKRLHEATAPLIELFSLNVGEETPCDKLRTIFLVGLAIAKWKSYTLAGKSHKTELDI